VIPAKVQAAWLYLTGALRQDPRPADRKSVGLESQSFDQMDIFFKVVVVIAGHIAGIAV